MGTDMFADYVDYSKFQVGTVVVINVETGEFITGSTEDIAMEKFEQAFGWGVPAQMRVVGSCAHAPGTVERTHIVGQP